MNTTNPFLFSQEPYLRPPFLSHPHLSYILTVLLIWHKGMIGPLSSILSCAGNSLTIQSQSSLRELLVCPEDNLMTSVKTGDVSFFLGNAANGKPSGDHGSCQQSNGRPKGWRALFHGSSTQHLNTPMCMGTWVIITSSLKISPSCLHGIIISWNAEWIKPSVWET